MYIIYQVAPFDLANGFLLVCAVVISTQWQENKGEGGGLPGNNAKEGAARQNRTKMALQVSEVSQ